MGVSSFEFTQKSHSNDCLFIIVIVIIIIGQHYFVHNTTGAAGLSPKWDFTSSAFTKNNRNAFVVAAKVNGSAAPTGPQDIDWVSLINVPGKAGGELAKVVYRTDTRLGQPPANVSFSSFPHREPKISDHFFFFLGNLKSVRKALQML